MSTSAPSALSFSQLKERAKDEFSSSTTEPQFYLASPQRLKIKVNGLVYARLGTMIAYRGNLKFQRGSGGSLGQKILKAYTEEGPSYMNCEGDGTLWLADQGKHIQLLHLQNQTISVNGNDLLMMEKNLAWKVCFQRTFAGAIGAGLFNVEVTGTGVIAVTTQGEPATFLVSPNTPLLTDPHATVAWSGNLRPDVERDSNFIFLERTSGETLQMHFHDSSEGFVLIQPYEERPPRPKQGSSSVEYYE